MTLARPDPGNLIATIDQLVDAVNAGGGGSLASVNCAIWTGGPGNGVNGDLIPALIEMNTFFPSLTLSYGPVVVGAGGQIAQVHLSPGIDVTVDASIEVSNMDGTETLIAYSSANIVLLAGTPHIMDQADWTAPSGSGTDLSIDAGGWIVSAAGGSFWVTLNHTARSTP